MQSNQLLIEKYNRLQSSLLIFLSIFFTIIALVSPFVLTYYFQYYLLLIAVSFIGLPHGFFDYSIAERLFSYKKNWIYYFTISYIFLSLIYLFFWFEYPLELSSDHYNWLNTYCFTNFISSRKRILYI